jgi:hypothetical protein
MSRRGIHRLGRNIVSDALTVMPGLDPGIHQSSQRFC